MKGIVFTEYLEYLEVEHGYNLVDDVLETSDLPSGGIYTAVGSYDFNEMVTLLTHTCEKTGKAPDKVLNEFGQHLFGVFVKGYPTFFEGTTSSFDILGHLEDHIHPEVQKLYPDAELPTFEVLEHSENRLTMIYRSSRKMGPFAHGLIEAAMNHFQEEGEIDMKNLTDDGSEVKFDIRKAS